MMRIRMIKPMGKYIRSSYSLWRTSRTKTGGQEISMCCSDPPLQTAVKFPYADCDIQHPQGTGHGREDIDQTHRQCPGGVGRRHHRPPGDIFRLRSAAWT